MSHAIILPILIPFAAAIATLALHRAAPIVVRTISLTSVLLLLAAALLLVRHATLLPEPEIYRLGSWPAPFGIVLVLDRVAALMVGLPAAIALASLLHAIAGSDGGGRHFHSLFQLLLAGLAGAFLTGDVFNLFVFFEVLLLASYGLLLHGGGRERARAGLAYVVLNLVGSAMFLIALALIYGTLGTLTIADLASLLPIAPAENRALIRTAFALLICVFLLKAALFPLAFWLPHAYGAASPAVAAMFAVLTKVGVYALWRMSTLVFEAAPFTADLLQPWLTPLALATIAIGSLGALAASRLAVVAANLVLVSTGTLLAVLPLRTEFAGGAMLFYLVHSSLATAGLFLISGLIAEARGACGDRFMRGPELPRGTAMALGGGFAVLAVALAGLPPFSGFLGKLMLLRATQAAAIGPSLWTALLASSLVAAVVLARGGSALFWLRDTVASPDHIGRGKRTPPHGALLLAAAAPLLVLLAAPLDGFLRGAAAHGADRRAHVSAVLGPRPLADIERQRRP